MSRRIAVVLSHPVQYFSPWFQHVARTTDLTVRVFYLWDAGAQAALDRGFGQILKWDVPLLEGYQYEFVSNVSRDPGTHHFDGLDNPALLGQLAEWQPDAILMFGYNYRSHVRLILSRRLRTVPLLFRGDSHELSRSPSLRNQLGRILRSLLFQRFAAFLSVGSAHREYLLSSRVNRSRIYDVPHCVDNDRFRAAAPAAARASREWRQRFGIPVNATMALFAGKFEPVKSPELLMRAFLRLPRELKERDAQNVLVLVGAGILEESLRTLAGDRVDRDVFFVPFQNQSEMPPVYASADLLVLPSKSESWGLVVNEVMNFAKPVVVSSHVGCAADLVVPNETGWVFESGDENALRSVLIEAFSNAARLSRMGENAARLVSGFSYASATSALQRALDDCCAQSLRPRSVAA